MVDRESAHGPGKYMNVYIGEDYNSLLRFTKPQLVSMIHGQAEMMERVPKLLEDLSVLRKEQADAATVIVNAHEDILRLEDMVSAYKQEVSRLKDQIAALNAREVLAQEAQEQVKEKKRRQKDKKKAAKRVIDEQSG